ncbi:CbiQ family ECF transporter T component [soil metagenome]
MSLHPGAWLVWALCSGLAAMVTTNPFYLLPLAAVAWVVYAARRTPGPALRSFRVFVTFGVVALATRTVLVLFGPVTSGSVVLAALEGLRLAVLLMVFGTFNSVADPYRMLKLAPRRVHEPALAAALALSIAPRYIEAVARVKEAQRMRGIEVRRWRSLPALTVPVLETGMEEALSLAESMDARGHGRGPRSRYRPERFGPASWATALVSGSALVGFVALERGGADLVMAALPLRWPEVSWAHLGAILLLALPAFVTEGRPE